MTPEQAQQYADAIGIPVEMVWAEFFYWQHGGP